MPYFKHIFKKDKNPPLTTFPPCFYSFGSRTLPLLLLLSILSSNSFFPFPFFQKSKDPRLLPSSSIPKLNDDHKNECKKELQRQLQKLWCQQTKAMKLCRKLQFLVLSMDSLLRALHLFSSFSAHSTVELRINKKSLQYEFFIYSRIRELDYYGKWSGSTTNFVVNV